jgi:alpha-D-ribose 1-methylphosphonate 5-triphosphate synthase subunit PhnG
VEIFRGQFTVCIPIFHLPLTRRCVEWLDGQADRVTSARLSEGLAAAARVRRDDLLDRAEQIASDHRVFVLDAPRPASTMVELETPVGAFCFTEVVVTTARVRVDGAEGWGCALGWDEEGALAAALVDAAGDREAQELAAQALADEAAARLETARLVAASRVERADR